MPAQRVKKGYERMVRLRVAPNLGSGYIEAVLLDPDGGETVDKRVT